jgi:hypothetical protein
MRPRTQDPTAGRRAQAISERPEVPQPIPDPTDPRYGELSTGEGTQGANADRILDPTDPEYGEPTA